MCRLVAHLGAPLGLDALLYRPEHSLEHQSWAPRDQRHGTINADGWGVGWYDRTIRPEPARYRTTRPLWTDDSFRSIAPLVRTGCALAVVRSATAPALVDEANTPPFAAGRWLFAHNGAVPGWRTGVNVALRAGIGPARLGAIEGSTDSETLFALSLDRLDRGDPPGTALRAVVATTRQHAEDARLNMVLTDGEQLAATVWGDTLAISCDDTGVVLASEPLDADRPWQPLADRHVVTVDADGVTIGPLDPEPHGATP
jgi:glutamine amidotransferase